MLDPARRNHGPRNQRGAALLVVLLLIIVAAASIGYGFVNPAKHIIEHDKTTAAALAQAREALIGFAAGVDIVTSQRPGDLPCPDTNNDGSADTPCNTPAKRIGRLPWKTFGLPDLRDGAGERLWYAVSTNFVNNPRTGMLNSDTPGDFTVNTATGAINNVIAIVFSPGPMLAGQIRDAANQNNIANYLEGENANGDAIFATGIATDTFNDKSILITQDNFFPAVEMRVTREIRAVLQAYLAANLYLPYANSYADGSYQCTPSQMQGRIPLTVASGCAAHADWGGAAVLPAWFTVNNWNQLVHYAVAPACSSPLSPSCSGAGGLLTVTNPPPNINVRALVIVTGRALGTQTRPCASVTDCLEDPENTNNDNVFVATPVSATANDRLAIVAP